MLFGSIGVFAASKATRGPSQVALYLMVGIVLWHVVYQAQIAAGHRLSRGVLVAATCST